MPATQEAVQICLFELADKDQAAIQRIVSFAASQGKPYVLNASVDSSAIIIFPDYCLPPPAQAVHICIGEAQNVKHDFYLLRPLLVTRVMRVLDEALHLLQSRPETEPTPPEAAGTLAPQEPIIATQTENIPPNPETDSYAYTALVVDDSAAIRKQLEIELRNAEILAEFAETGEEALDKSSAKQYDLVFLDIVMPGIDGYEVCRQMRSRREMKKTPIIMLSGKTSPLDEVQGVIAGASTYLTKPVKHEHFQQTLKRVSRWLTNFAP
jgi:CheY-like chemotaxis protein